MVTETTYRKIKDKSESYRGGLVQAGLLCCGSRQWLEQLPHMALNLTLEYKPGQGLSLRFYPTRAAAIVTAKNAGIKLTSDEIDWKELRTSYRILEKTSLTRAHPTL